MVSHLTQKDYDSAAAVFSRSFRFVEWKLIIASASGSLPFGDKNESPLKAIKNIDREKWIYVFAHANGETYAEVKEEIQISAEGKMAATPFELIEKDGKRSNPVSIGTSLCLPRRIKGFPQVYRFFACRVRLPIAQIKELKKSIATFAPATSLEPGINTSVVEKQGELLVPVVDAVTVMLHLHAAYVAAASDVIDYTVAHDDASKENPRKKVERRRKKQLLASILSGIMDSDPSNTVVQKLKDRQGPVEQFLTHYEAAVQWRVDRRDRLATFLSTWHASAAMKVTEAAFAGSPKAEWVRFLIPWCQAITRLGESPSGRAYLEKIIDDSGHFVHRYVWPQAKLSDDQVQSVRKAGMTVLEAWKAIAEVKILIKRGAAAEIFLSLQLLLQPLKGGAATLSEQAILIHRYNRVNSAIRAAKFIVPDSSDTIHHFASSPRKLGAIVESVNLLFAVAATMDVMKNENASRRDKELAIIGLIGSSLDAASALASLSRNADKLAGVLGFVSGIVDLYLGVTAMNKAFSDGDQDLANGNFLTSVGATFAASAPLMALFALPGGAIVGVIGLGVMAIGFFYKVFSGDSAMERFFEHCTWGLTPAQAGAADWSPTRFEEWKGDKEFDRQLEALLNILCRIEVGYGDSYRHLRYTIGWIPPNSKLVVVYEEGWVNGADSGKVTGEVTLSEKTAVSNKPTLIGGRDGQNVVTLEVIGTGQPNSLTKKKPNATLHVHGMKLPNPELRRSAASGKLVIMFEGAPEVSVPHNGWAKETFF